MCGKFLHAVLHINSRKPGIIQFKRLILSTLESVKGWYDINNIYLVIVLGLNITIEKLLMFQLLLSKLKLILQPSGL